jgi:hypothetical protein
MAGGMLSLHGVTETPATVEYVVVASNDAFQSARPDTHLAASPAPTAPLQRGLLR